jgi:2-iminobutanoate/2-iminopropanoate deaminase
LGRCRPRAGAADAAWTEFLGDNLPTRATVGVADLGGSALIEVVVTALEG